MTKTTFNQIILIALTGLSFIATSNPVIAKETPKPQAISINTNGQNMSEDQKTLYALGYNLGSNLSVFSLTSAELDTIKKGLTDSTLKAPSTVDMNIYFQKVQNLAKQRSEKFASKYIEEGKKFTTQAIKENKAAKVTSTGLVYIPISEGTGQSPSIKDTVKVHYKGTLTNGTEFDSSYKTEKPVEFPLSNVIKCWGEGLQLMKTGGKARLICPSNIAYGNKGTPDGTIQPGSTLNFEVELLEIKNSK